ncbi:hypothetical protein [Bradyrhizobium sp. LMTR 3]|uniref:hypothetical protein n=1 Tax=Bradyrhizobium sp. LMTR 3 TaxID=189873 RepID=UPI0008105522|nr:hypothetical protein [Bradyrhizobium sp. LMTR 3]OCK59447.1 hypothetical protein LMTR3_17305 [Bradyrhizobium sp. LMTR 3]
MRRHSQRPAVALAFGGFARVAALGLGENALQALAQGILAGPAALYLFAFSIQTIDYGASALNSTSPSAD